MKTWPSLDNEQGCLLKCSLQIWLGAFLWRWVTPLTLFSWCRRVCHLSRQELLFWVPMPLKRETYVLFSEFFLGLPFLSCLQHRRVHMLKSLFWGGVFLFPSLSWFFLHWDRLLKSYVLQFMWSVHLGTMTLISVGFWYCCDALPSRIWWPSVNNLYCVFKKAHLHSFRTFCGSRTHWAHVSISQHKEEREEGTGGGWYAECVWTEDELMAKAEYLLLASPVSNPAAAKRPCFPVGSISFPFDHVWPRWGSCSGIKA